jgi:S-methylmethionine-dependent homocysteine/selenocysteine methylase
VAPDVVQAVHEAYAALGCDAHRTNTFRTRAGTAGSAWTELARRAVRLARGAARPGQRVLGSLGPIEDCYRPDLAPSEREAETMHAELASLLAAEGVDGLLCETFPSALEARAATRACAATGLPVWVALTAGPSGDLMTPADMREAARACVGAGASTVLVNCVAAERTAPFVAALAGLGVPFGAYANAAPWNGPPIGPADYARAAEAWRASGATVLGACCGTGPAHVDALMASCARR